MKKQTPILMCLIAICLSVVITHQSYAGPPDDRDLSGEYRIRVKANGQYLHENGLGDKLVSTRYQSDDDFTCFFLDSFR